MKMASRSIDLISKKTNCTCSTLFFSNKQKTDLHVQHAFCLSLPLFSTTTTLFCRTKTSNFPVTCYFCFYVVHVLLYMYMVKCNQKLQDSDFISDRAVTKLLSWSFNYFRISSLQIRSCSWIAFGYCCGWNPFIPN